MNDLLLPYRDGCCCRNDFPTTCFSERVVDLHGTTNGPNNNSLRSGTRSAQRIGVCNENVSMPKQVKRNGQECNDYTWISRGSPTNKCDFCRYEKEWKPLCNHTTCEPTPAHNLHDDQEIKSCEDPNTSKFQCPAEEHFSYLQHYLLDMCLPATVDRSMEPRQTTQNDIAIVYLSEVSDAITTMLEGNRKYPGSVLFVLTASWVSRIPSPHDPSQDWLYVHKAITSDAGGQTHIDCFVPPRRATYVINLLLRTTTDKNRSEGQALTQFGLDCPMSSTLQLSNRADNKLFTRTLCATVGVAHPVTLGLWLRDPSSKISMDCHSTITVVELPGKDVTEDWVYIYVSQFLSSENLRPYAKIVVKPYGEQWCSSLGVTYHSKSNVTDIISAILNLISKIVVGEGVLVESFHDTIQPQVPDTTDHDVHGRNLGIRVRSIVSRTSQNGARMTTNVCGVAGLEMPVNGENTFPSSLELTLRLWGLCDTKVQDICNTIKRNVEDFMLEFMKRENQLSPLERGSATARTDLLGVDIVLTKINGVITPVVIEVNSHSCLFATTLFEIVNREFLGQTSFVLLQTMLTDSQKYLLREKVVVVIGAGGYNIRQLWSDSQAFNGKVVLIDSECCAKTGVHKFLHYDMTNHTQDQKHADHLVKVIKTEVGHIDGCLTFEEVSAPLVALVTERLSLKCTSSHRAVTTALKKCQSMEILKTYTVHHSIVVQSSVFTSPVVRLNGPEDLELIPLPAVMKLEYSSYGYGTKKICNYAEALEHMAFLQKTMLKEQSLPGIGFENKILLMQELLGTEHEVEMVLLEGEVMAAFISDTGVTRKPLFTKTVSTMPSVLSEEEQNQLVYGAATCCRKLELLTGVFNVKMFMTLRGPKFLEVNNRMGRAYHREWIRKLYDVDLLHVAMMAACGVRPVTGSSIVKGYNSNIVRKERGQILGIMLYANRHGHALSTSATPEHLWALHKQGTVLFTQLGSEVKGTTSAYEKPFGNLAVCKRTLFEAHANLVSVCETLGLETKESLKDSLGNLCMPRGI